MRRRRWILVVALGALLGLASRGARLAAAPQGGGPESLPHRPRVRVDGDLEDLIRASQGFAPDPCNDVFPLCRSGMDVTALYAFYDVVDDRLVVGLDVADGAGPGAGAGDGSGCTGLPGAGVAGDVDGDGDPNAASDFPLCAARDAFGVGPEEYYMILVDTDRNGRFADREDLWVVYRDNRLHFEDGRGDPLPTRGSVALGVAGATEDPHMPHQNRATEDFEVSVEGFSRYDQNPSSFGVQILCGATFFGPPDETLSAPLIVDLGRGGGRERHAPGR